MSDGRLFESTGEYGESTLREIDPSTGKLLRKRPLAKQVFGEGLTLLGNEMWVLTWKENTAYVFEPDTFNFIRSHHYQGEGWGLTTDGKQLVMSDGSSKLKFIKPDDFSVIRTLAGQRRRQPGQKPQRTRMDRWPDLRQHLHDRTDRANLAGNGPGHRLARSHRTAQPTAKAKPRGSR